MKSVLLGLLFFGITYAQAEPAAVCYQSGTKLSLQLFLDNDQKFLTALFAEVEENDIHLIDFMTNAKIGPEDFKSMIRARKIEISAYPEGAPEEAGRSMAISIQGNRGALSYGSLLYQFDRCELTAE